MKLSNRFLESYKDITEVQSNILEGSLLKHAKIPPPEELNSSNSRFKSVTQNEIEEFKKFIIDQKQNILQNDQQLNSERKELALITQNLDEDKVRISK